MIEIPKIFKAGSRTRREMPYEQRRWNLVEKWLEENGFKPIAQDGDRHRYRRRMGWTMPSAFIELNREGSRMTLEAWIRADRLLVFNLLMRQEPEIQLDRGGLVAAMPRLLMRRRLNTLLEKLKQPRIV
jgi:hypothetical protein